MTAGAAAYCHSRSPQSEYRCLQLIRMRFQFAYRRNTKRAPLSRVSSVGAVQRAPFVPSTSLLFARRTVNPCAVDRFFFFFFFLFVFLSSFFPFFSPPPFLFFSFLFFSFLLFPSSFFDDDDDDDDDEDEDEGDDGR